MAEKFYYGGQAVIEGVMMRGRKARVVAVRRPGGGLAFDTKPLSAIYTGWMRKTPLVRGIIVLIEAMASGLCVLADNWGGAKDRITKNTGFLIDEEWKYIDIINSLTPEILEQKGKAARERAKKEFVKEKWIEEILGEK